MKLLRVLYVTAELSPFTGDSALARESRFLSQEMAQLGLDVTLMVPGRAMTDPDSMGLARRLTPLVLSDPDREVTIYEGATPGGRVEVIAIQVPDEIDQTGVTPGETADETFCRAVHALIDQRDDPPNVVLASHGGEGVLTAFATTEPTERMPLPEPAEGLPSPPAGEQGARPAALVFALRRFEESAQLVETLGHSDLVMVPSSHWAQALREAPDSHRAGALVGPVAQRVRGVTPGIDSLEWNPRRDSSVAADFLADPAGHKARHKETLQRQLGLRVTPRLPLIALVGPVDPTSLTYTAATELSQRNIELVVLANRQRDHETLRGLDRLANQSSTRIAIRTPDDPHDARTFEHTLMAAADFALFAPPPGPGTLSELYCMHYGAVPIAPRSGTFADTLVEFDSVTATGSGFLFEPGDGEHLVAAVDRALRVYARPGSTSALTGRAIEMDLSWQTAAQRYVNLFLEVLREKGQLAA